MNTTIKVSKDEIHEALIKYIEEKYNVHVEESCINVRSLRGRAFLEGAEVTVTLPSK